MTFFQTSTIIKLYFKLVEVAVYINRTLEKGINHLTKQFKVILVTGARQVGKSTLLKFCGKEYNYVTLDDYRAREMAINEPELFLQKYQAPLIIDEIQYAPQLLSYIKMFVDNSEKIIILFNYISFFHY